MSETRKVWVVEEVADANGLIGQRQTQCDFALVDTNNNTWHWIRPDERLNADQQAEWSRVLNLLKNVNGEDLRHVVCCAGLIDHCLRPTDISGSYYDPITD